MMVRKTMEATFLPGLAIGLARKLIARFGADRRAEQSSGPHRRASNWIAPAFVCLVAISANLFAGGEKTFLSHVEQTFVGRVVSARSEAADGGRLIRTRYRFSIEERDGRVWTAELVEFGGTLGDTTLTLSHGVSYRLGLTYLVFAAKDESGLLRTVGGPPGRLLVLVDRSGRQIVRVYPGHPLASLFEGGTGVFHGVDEIQSRLSAVGVGAKQ